MNQIENPNPRLGTNNWDIRSGYPSGSYTNCSDESASGVTAPRGYLARLPNQTFNDGNCEQGAYYLVTLRAIPGADPSTPISRPAIGDLTSLFQF